MTYKLMRCTPCGGTGKTLVLVPGRIGAYRYAPCPVCNGSGKGFR